MMQPCKPWRARGTFGPPALARRLVPLQLFKELVPQRWRRLVPQGRRRLVPQSRRSHGWWCGLPLARRSLLQWRLSTRPNTRRVPSWGRAHMAKSGRQNVSQTAKG